MDCQQPETIKYGQVTLPTNATYYGATASYECDKNFILDGVSRRLCQEDGTWSNEMPVCREVTCDNPEISENLIIEPLTSNGIGSTLQYKCPKGRTMIGNETRSCMINGQWSGKAPFCKRKF